MIVVNKQSSRSGVVVGETQKSFKILALSNKETWLPKQFAVVDHPYYESQLAMHLWHGYASDSVHDLGSIDKIAKLSAFVPALILADRKLDAQLQRGSRVWNKVFCYDVAQAAGAWLAQNPNATFADFSAHLETLIAFEPEAAQPLREYE